ncbi:MAG: response regulator transcription factor [Candidatus Kapaibacteriota bacterium]|jgi:DNA-binding response OmpR family regulator
MVKIAIIDDDIDIVDAVKLILTSKGYQVVSAMNANDGLKLIETEKPDIILLDVMMEEPDDGFFLAMKLRKMGIKTPIFLLTSIAKVTGFDYGANDVIPIEEFLEKPVQSEVLIEKINKYLRQK